MVPPTRSLLPKHRLVRVVLGMALVALLGALLGGCPVFTRGGDAPPEPSAAEE
ncbi:MAG: hypothetical protein AB7S26_19570 [Sandaracinaceae bacterium]